MLVITRQSMLAHYHESNVTWLELQREKRYWNSLATHRESEDGSLLLRYGGLSARQKSGHHWEGRRPYLRENTAITVIGESQGKPGQAVQGVASSSEKYDSSKSR